MAQSGGKFAVWALRKPPLSANAVAFLRFAQVKASFWARNAAAQITLSLRWGKVEETVEEFDYLLATQNTGHTKSPRPHRPRAFLRNVQLWLFAVLALIPTFFHTLRERSLLWRFLHCNWGVYTVRSNDLEL